MSRIYLISPVRQATEADRVAMDEYVRGLEAQGHEVHLPHRDVDQSNDDGGLRIVKAHRLAMAQADEIHVWVKPDGTISEGEHFDLGMAYMMQLFADWPVRFRLCGNPLPRTEHKSFTNVLKDLAGTEL